MKSACLRISISRGRVWPNQKPTEQHQPTKSGIAGNKDPRRRLKIQELVQPMGYERTIVNSLTCPRPQTHFPGCERANETKPGLQNDNPDCNQVHTTEPHISHPLPLQKKACINQHQPENDKSHEQHMRNKYRVSGKRIQRTEVDKAS